jgi:hypothetical protein
MIMRGFVMHLMKGAKIYQKILLWNTSAKFFVIRNQQERTRLVNQTYDYKLSDITIYMTQPPRLIL